MEYFVVSIVEFPAFTYLSKQLALWPFTEIGQLTFDHQVAVLQEDVEESSSGKLGLYIDHQLKEALAEIDLGVWNLPCQKIFSKN